MRATTPEWRMVVDLHHAIKKVRFKNQKSFIEDLHEYLDEFAPFLSQRSEDQLRWLTELHDYYIKP